MNPTFDLVSGLLIQQIDFVDDALENLVETVVASAGKVQAQSLLIDQSKGDEDISETVSGITELAETVGAAFTQLSDTQKTTLQNAVNKLVRYPDNPTLEGALEGLFAHYLNLLESVKALNGYVADNQSGE